MTPPIKTIWYTVLASTIIFLAIWVFSKYGPGLPLSVNLIQTTKDNLFTVSGEGKASAAPNLAVVNLGIQTTRPTVTQAQTSANDTMERIINDLKNIGLENKDMTTSDYSIYPQYDFQSGRTISGYAVNINLTVKVHDLKKVNDVIDKATAAGANSVGGLNFTFDDQLKRTLENDARSQAIAMAKKKAENLAALTGIRLGRIVDVQENQTFLNPRPMPMAISAEPGIPDKALSQTQVQPGSSEITLSVSLSYEIR